MLVAGSTAPASPPTKTGAARRARSLTKPDRIDRYLVIDRLGAGGMGVVFAAYDPELDRKVAIKLLRPGREGARAQSRMLREAQAMARLSHPNVVQIYDVGTARGQVFLAMELIVGRTIRAWLEAETPGWRAIVENFLVAGHGLAAAHEVGIVHRDFKPDNVLIGDDGRVRVADFGIASYAGADDHEAGAVNTFLQAPLTATGALVGTPRYMAPEQHAGSMVGPAADQFSFCVALFEALYQALPFKGATLSDVVENARKDRVSEPEQSGRAPRWVAQVLRRGLRGDPEQRYPDLRELLRALDYRARRNRHRALAGTGATIVLATVGTMALWSGDEPCRGGAEAMAASWHDARERLGSALVGADDADGAAAVLTGALDDYAATWAAEHRRMCEGHLDGSVSADRLDASMACLERRRDGLDTLVGLLEDEAATPSAAVVAAAKLPPVGPCTSRDAPDDRWPTADDPELEDAVAQVRTGLAQAQVKHDAGQIDAARQELDALAVQADALAFAPLTAELSLVTGRLAMERLDWPAAEPRLRRAVQRGVAAGLDSVAAEAKARMIFVTSMLTDGPEQALSHATWAASLAERAGQPEHLRALLANNVGAVQAMHGDRAAAVASFSSALEFAEASSRVNPIDRAGYSVNLALLTEDAQARDRLFAQAEASVASALGSSHFERLDATIRWAECTADPAAALQRLAPACAEVGRRHGDGAIRCHQCFWREAELRDVLDDRVGAAEAADAAAACLAPPWEPEGPEPYLKALEAKARALAALMRDDPTQAADRAAAADALLRPKADLEWIAFELAGATVLRARAAVALGEDPGLGADLDAAARAYERRATMSEDQAAPRRLGQVAALRQRLSAMP